MRATPHHDELDVRRDRRGILAVDPQVLEGDAALKKTRREIEAGKEEKRSSLESRRRQLNDERNELNVTQNENNTKIFNPTTPEAEKDRLRKENEEINKKLKTVQESQDKLNVEMVKVFKRPDVQTRLTEMGAEYVGSSPQELSKQLANDVRIWAKWVKDVGVRVE